MKSKKDDTCSRFEVGAAVSSSSSLTRLTKTCVHLPLVYGSMAFPLKKVEEYNTHQWTLYVRGPFHEDLSYAISKVTFQLHPSFIQPIRELTIPPYEVTEKGWGEFDVTIRIVWKDEFEKPLVLTSPLKLYPYPGMVTTTNTTAGISEPILYETYDEVVFTDPLETFYNQLMLIGGPATTTAAAVAVAGGSNKTTTNIIRNNNNHFIEYPKIYSKERNVQERFPLYSDEEDVKILLEAQKFIAIELSSVKDRILKARQGQEELDIALLSAAAMKKGGHSSTTTITSMVVGGPSSSSSTTITNSSSNKPLEPIKSGTTITNSITTSNTIYDNMMMTSIPGVVLPSSSSSTTTPSSSFYPGKSPSSSLVQKNNNNITSSSITTATTTTTTNKNKPPPTKRSKKSNTATSTASSTTTSTTTLL